MKKNTCKIGTFTVLAALMAVAVLTLSAVTITGASQAYPARFLAQAPDETTTPEDGLMPAAEEQATPEAGEEPALPPEEPAEAAEETGPCATLRANEQTNASPLTTVSDTCAQAEILAGDLAFDYLPDSFSFPIKELSQEQQDSFSNDYEGTPELDAETGPEDILSLHDYRNSGGFSVTITASGFESSNSEIPLTNLFVATTYPDEDDFDSLDTALYGDESGGVEYAAGSNGPQDIAAKAFTQADTNLPDSYLTSFDGNGDGNPDIVELMNTSSPHIGRFSQAVNFYLRIPAGQPSGSYQTKFTLDLIY